MSFLKFVLVAISLASFFHSPSIAQPNAHAVLNLHPEQDATAIGHYLYFGNYASTVDANNFQELLSSQLEKGDNTTNEFGDADEPISILLHVRNTGLKRGKWVYSTGRGSLLSIKLFEFSLTHGYFEHLSSEQPETLGKNLRQYHSFSFSFELDPGEETTLGVQFQPTNSTWLPLILKTENSFYNDIVGKSFLTLGSVVGIAILILFGGMLYATTGQKVFLLLIVAEIGLALQILHQTGYTTIYYFIDHREIGRSFGEVAKCIFVLGMAQFARQFLETKTTLPSYDFFLKLLLGVTWFILALLISYPLFSLDLLILLYFAAWMLTALTAIYIPFIALAAVKRKGHVYTPLLIGWTTLALYIILTMLASFGVIPGVPGQWYWVAPVGLFDGLCMTFSLALSIGHMHRQSLETQVALNESLSEKLAISEEAQRLSDERALAVSTLEDNSALLHSASHDSKQVLMSLNIINDVLSRKEDGGLSSRMRQMLNAAVGHLNDIVATTFSPSTQGTAHLTCPAFTHSSVCDLTAPIVRRYEMEANKKGLGINCEIDPKLSIVSDFALLNRVLSNLMNNAVKFTQGGSITIKGKDHLSEVEISIQDTGIGMSQAQIAASLKSNGLRVREHNGIKGSGVGLKYCNRILHLLAAEFEITSSSKGTLVSIFLPKIPRSPQQLPHNIVEVDFEQLNADEKKQIKTAQNNRNLIVCYTADQSLAMREELHKVAHFIIYRNCPDSAVHHPAILREAKALLDTQISAPQKKGRV